jgi:4'-phosphopantetheinyl transferase EntD
LMTTDEIAVVLAQGWTSDIAIAQNLAFLAKEALFKYQYPITGRRELEFDEVRLQASERTGVLATSCATDDPALQSALSPARVFHEEIHGLRMCWVLPRS